MLFKKKQRKEGKQESIWTPAFSKPSYFQAPALLKDLGFCFREIWFYFQSNINGHRESIRKDPSQGSLRYQAQFCPIQVDLSLCL